MSCGVGCRRGSDPELLWLWYRPGATALIRPLAWKPPCATGAALERTKKKKKSKSLPFHGPFSSILDAPETRGLHRLICS